MRTPAAVLGAVTLLLAAAAGAFEPGEIYWAAGDCLPTCGLFLLTPGSQAGTSPLAALERTPGQMAFDHDLGAAYVTQFGTDSIARVGRTGATSTFASGISGPTGILRRSDGVLLAVSFRNGAVYDASDGGDLSSAAAFASGFSAPRNLVQLSSGAILLADQGRRAVYEISGGGDFSSALPFAWGLPLGPFDLVEDEQGRVFATTANGVYQIGAGGDFTFAAPHATGRNFMGLALDGGGRLLASDLDSGDVYDVTAGGDYASAAPFASGLPGSGETALDTVPGNAAPFALPALEPLAAALLAALLGATAARRCTGGG